MGALDACVRVRVCSCADPSLDFFSGEFDAARALHTVGLKPPLPVAPLQSWPEAAALVEVDPIYADLFQTETMASPAAAAVAPSAGAASAAASSTFPAPPAAATPSISAWPSGDGTSLLDMLDDSRYNDHASQPNSAPAASTTNATRLSAMPSSVPPPSAAAHSAVSAIAALPVPPALISAASAPAVPAPASAPASAPGHAPVGVVSRMSAEQIRINREKAAKKAQENANRRGEKNMCECAWAVGFLLVVAAHGSHFFLDLRGCATLHFG